MTAKGNRGNKINRVEIDGDIVCIVRGNRAYVYDCKEYRIEHLRELLRDWIFSQEECFEYSSKTNTSVGIIDWYTNPCIDMGLDRKLYYVRGSIHRNVIFDKLNRIKEDAEYTTKETITDTTKDTTGYTELLMRGRFTL